MSSQTEACTKGKCSKFRMHRANHLLILRLERGMEFKSGKMGLSTRASGKTTKQQGKALFGMRRGTFMSENSKTTKRMGLESTLTLMEANTPASGTMTTRRAREKKSGWTEQNTRGSTRKERSTATDFICGATEASSLAIGKTIKSQDLESTTGQTDEFTRATGWRTRCTAKASTGGRMEGCIMEITFTIRKKAMASTPTQMAAAIRGSGRIQSSMAKAPS